MRIGELVYWGIRLRRPKTQDLRHKDGSKENALEVKCLLKIDGA